MYSNYYSDWKKKIYDSLEIKKELYKQLLSFIDNDMINNIDINLELINFIQSEIISKDEQETKEFLFLLVKLANNHHRQMNLYKKIEMILDAFSSDLKEMISNSELFNIFKNNKLLLLYLFENKTIFIEDSIVQYILQKKSRNDIKYSHFFYPEIEPFISIEEQNKIKSELNDFDQYYFNIKRHEGENDSYISKLIRTDSIQDFVTFINRNNYSLVSQIKPSIFETNSFLLGKSPTLIEYAAFYGSVEIFTFLEKNNVPLKSSVWLYTIHGQNAELIHFLEENHIEPKDETYEECLQESIKCHHNEFAQYFINNCIKNYESDSIFEYGFHYHNYNYLPDKINSKSVFNNICHYNYLNLVRFYVNEERYKDNTIIVRNLFEFTKF